MKKILCTTCKGDTTQHYPLFLILGRNGKVWYSVNCYITWLKTNTEAFNASNSTDSQNET